MNEDLERLYGVGKPKLIITIMVELDDNVPGLWAVIGEKTVDISGILLAKYISNSRDRIFDMPGFAGTFAY